VRGVIGAQPQLYVLAGSVLSGLFAGTVTHPLDTVKTCMQGDVERRSYKGGRWMLECLFRLFVCVASFLSSCSLSSPMSKLLAF
jgi:hypothetical protein